jgi:hypothetical protein
MLATLAARSTVPVDLIVDLPQRPPVSDSEIPVPCGSSASELRAFYAAWRSELTA